MAKKRIREVKYPARLNLNVSNELSLALERLSEYFGVSPTMLARGALSRGLRAEADYRKKEAKYQLQLVRYREEHPDISPYVIDSQSEIKISELFLKDHEGDWESDISEYLVPFDDDDYPFLAWILDRFGALEEPPSEPSRPLQPDETEKLLQAWGRLPRRKRKSQRKADGSKSAS